MTAKSQAGFAPAVAAPITAITILPALRFASALPVPAATAAITSLLLPAAILKLKPNTAVLGDQAVGRTSGKELKPVCSIVPDTATSAMEIGAVGRV